MPSHSALPANILVVEDNIDLQTEMIDFLTLSGHQAEGAGNLASMKAKLQQHAFQILLLDLGLPDGDSLNHIQDIRQQYGLTLGIIIVSARGSDEERIIGLQKGADAYLVKPINLFELNILLARLNQRVIKLQPAKNNGWRLIKSQNQLVAPGSQEISLTGIEYLLLEHLINTNSIQQRTDLCEALYPEGEHANPRRLDTLVSRLRLKVKLACEQELPICAYRNKGYGLTDTIVIM